MSSFFFARNPLSRRVDLHERSRESLNQSLGITDDQLKVARANLEAVGAKSYPTEESVGGGVVRIRGEEFAVKESYRDGDQQISILARRSDAGRMEQVRVVEEYASDHTRVVSDVRGNRG